MAATTEKLCSKRRGPVFIGARSSSVSSGHNALADMKGALESASIFSTSARVCASGPRRRLPEDKPALCPPELCVQSVGLPHQGGEGKGKRGDARSNCVLWVRSAPSEVGGGVTVSSVWVRVSGSLSSRRSSPSVGAQIHNNPTFGEVRGQLAFPPLDPKAAAKKRRNPIWAAPGVLHQGGGEQQLEGEKGTPS
uniref:Uncharacterized protein n=1 Tax=Knipowitschia caucasica TaxID=637954 RepID=A0AAV2LBW8_KNICA